MTPAAPTPPPTPTFRMIFVNWVLNITLFAVSMIFVGIAGPEIETRWFPVYSKFKILNVEPNEKGGSVIEADYVKFRDCFPQG